MVMRLYLSVLSVSDKGEDFKTTEILILFVRTQDSYNSQGISLRKYITSSPTDQRNLNS